MTKLDYQRSTIWSENIQLDWNYSIFKPEKYDKYRVIYFLHGAGGNHTNYFEKSDLLNYLHEYNQRNEEKIIAIAVDGFNTFYVDKFWKMESAIIEEFIPKVEEVHGLVVNRDKRHLFGLSMGGFGAMNFLIKHSELFSKAYVMSAVSCFDISESTGLTHWGLYTGKEDYLEIHPWTNFEKYKDQMQPVELISYTGHQDQIVKDFEVKALMDKFKEAGLKVEDHYLEGGHDWDFWDGVMKEIFA